MVLSVFSVYTFGHVHAHCLQLAGASSNLTQYITHVKDGETVTITTVGLGLLVSK